MILIKTADLNLRNLTCTFWPTWTSVSLSEYVTVRPAAVSWSIAAILGQVDRASGSSVLVHSLWQWFGVCVDELSHASLSLSLSLSLIVLISFEFNAAYKAKKCSVQQRLSVTLYILFCLFRALLLWMSSVRSLRDSWCCTYLECLSSWSRWSYWCCDDWHIYTLCVCFLLYGTKNKKLPARWRIHKRLLLKT